MKRKEKDRPVGSTNPNPRFILCDPSGETPDSVTRPIHCLDKALATPPEYILIRFGRVPFKERNDLVELCATLKRNRYTRNYPLVALLAAKHRYLLESLNRAGVDFVLYIASAPLDALRLGALLNKLGPEDRTKNQLTTVCPFLHYSAIDSRRELTTCGAYLDRMVLGGRLLHDVCETRSHLHCGYYLNPRIKP